MSLWICKNCEKVVHCSLANLCPICGKGCERVINIEPVSEFSEKVSEFAKQLVLKFNTYVHHNTYYNIEEIYHEIYKIAGGFSLGNVLGFSTPCINDDTLTFTLYIHGEEEKEIFMEFNLVQHKFYLAVHSVKEEENAST